jgi:hypothetical protein
MKSTQIQLLIDLARQMQRGMHRNDENMNRTEMKCLGIAVAALACEGLARLVLVAMVVLTSFAYLAICSGRALEALKEPQLDDSPSDLGNLLNHVAAPNGSPRPAA